MNEALRMGVPFFLKGSSTDEVGLLSGFFGGLVCCWLHFGFVTSSFACSGCQVRRKFKHVLKSA